MELIQSDCPNRCRRYSSKAHGNPTVHHLGLAEQIISPAEASEYSSMTLLQRSIDKIKSFVDCSSVSSTSNAEISAAVADSLDVLGFDVEKTTYLDPRGVTKVNLVASRKPLAAGATEAGGLAYFCHTDVIPADHWTGPGGDPFKCVVRENRIYGRGSCDMKGSLVAMLSAVAKTLQVDQKAPLWIVCTADEEVGFWVPRISSRTQPSTATLLRHNLSQSLGNQHDYQWFMHTRGLSACASRAVEEPHTAARQKASTQTKQWYLCCRRCSIFGKKPRSLLSTTTIGLFRLSFPGISESAMAAMP